MFPRSTSGGRGFVPTVRSSPSKFSAVSTVKRRREFRVVLALASLSALPAARAALDVAVAPDVVALDALTVTEAKDTLSPPTRTEAAAALRQVAGAVSLIDADLVGKGRVGSVSDILSFQPGVYAQTAGGSDGIRISIRGSAINRGTGFFRSGTQFYFDGLPLTGAGGTPYELFEPLGLNYTEVLRGGNAFDYGSVALGGAINYVTHTGYDAAPFQLRAEAGSFGYIKGQVASGRVLGKLDYYASVTGSFRDGFQQQSQAETYGVAANVGYKVSPNVLTRFYLRHRFTDNEVPGFLTQAQLEADPTQANAVNVFQNNSRRQPGSTWIANKTTVTIDADSSLEAGVIYHDYPIEISPNPAPGTAAAPALQTSNSTWWFSDLGLSLKYTRADTLLGRESHSTAAFTTTIHPAAGVRVYGNNPNITVGAPGVFPFGSPIKRVNYDGSADTVLRFGNDTELAENLWLTTGLALVSIRRNSEFEYVSPLVTLPEGYQQSFRRTENHVAPRAGLRYQVSRDWLVFANVTRSIEPPNSWSPSSGSGIVTAANAGNGFLIADLKDQTATSYELGTRVQRGIFLGSLSVYHSDVKNELLSVQIAPGPPPVTRELNATPTTKQGIEAGLDAVLWHAGRETDPFKAATRVLLRQAFTLNRFEYDGDPTFGTNELPGIPREFYQAELLFEHASGFYAGANVQAASKSYVDYANTFEVDGYVIYGVRAGYDAPSGRWEAYVDVRNLTDEAHTVSVSPIFDTRADPAANSPARDLAQLSPGDGFGVFGGLTVRF